MVRMGYAGKTFHLDCCWGGGGGGTDKKIFEGVLSIFCNNLIIITACAVENPVVDETS